MRKGKVWMFALSLAILVAMAACDSSAAADPRLSVDTEAALLGDILADMELGELDSDQSYGLVLMREEEKLARDLYIGLYDLHGLRIFRNIARSEEMHMTALALLLQRYEIGDPVTDDTPGVFSNPMFTELYQQLLESGSASVMDGLMVGAAVEDLDIKDLMELSEEMDSPDILLVYENLTRGSRNHIRSFTRQIGRYGSEYTAQYISQSLLDSILATPMERGRY